MKVINILKSGGAPYVSFEILPPLKGQNIESLYGILDPLMEFKPPFVNVTYHSSEYIYKERGDGNIEKINVRKRPGTVGICAAIMFRYKVDAVAHLICGGFTRNETEDALIDLRYLGIKNLLILRGDPPKNENEFKPEQNGHKHAIDLIKQVVDINHGIYLEEDLVDGYKTDFCIGVAGYPEKHYESPNLMADVKYLKTKIDAGAEYITTQMFFDNKKFFDYKEICKAQGIDAPIIPGIKCITSRKQITMLPRTFNVDIPNELYEEINKCKSDADAQHVGIEWAIAQGKELLQSGVPCLHFFTMSNPKPIVEIVRALF